MPALLSFLIPYKLAIIAAALLSAVVFIDRRATYRERAKCDAAAIQSQLNAVRADLDIEKIARANDEKIAAELAVEKSNAEKKNAELEKAFAGRCIATDDDVKRLR